MSTLRALRALAPADARGVWRDPLLRWIMAVPLGLGLAARDLIPGLLAQARAVLPFDLGPHYWPLIGACLLLIGPLLAGMVVGFLLLDQRDEGTLLAMRVTPLPAWAYLAYRLGLPLLASLPLTLLAFALAGLPLDGARLAGALLLAAPLGPIYALALAALARNKVQGFAISKAAGIFIAAPLAAYFMPQPWPTLLLLAPTSWAARFFWEGQWWLLLGGLLYQAALLGLLLRVRVD
jgi:fluoroquinolone transport system permease protein